jgi:hypothetical protein
VYLLLINIFNQNKNILLLYNMSIAVSGTTYSDVDGSYQRNIVIDGKQIVYQEDNTPPIPNDSGSITWNDFFKLTTNLDAVSTAPNATTLKVENTLLLDDGVNTRTITATSNPATTINVGVTNENQTYYPIFTDTDGTSRTLLVDDATTALSYNPQSSQLTCSQINADIQSVNTTQSTTHFVGMFDSSATGYGRPQKSTGLTFVPSTRTLTITDGTNSTIITPTSNNATTVTTTNDNTSGTYYIPFVKNNAPANQQLFTDDVAGSSPLTYNPSTSTLTSTLFSPTSIQVSARVQLPTAVAEAPVFTAGTGTLALTNTTSGYSYTNWVYSHTSATNISALTLTNFRTFGFFTLYFTNNSGSSINWNTGLGANILTIYGTARTLTNGQKAIIRIYYDGTTYYIDYTAF